LSGDKNVTTIWRGGKMAKEEGAEALPAVEECVEELRTKPAVPLPTVEECIAEIKRKPLVNLWPTLAVLYDVSKGKIYQMAELGEVDVLKTGRLKKAVSASERRKLGI
jgi:hypothetical protein